MRAVLNHEEMEAISRLEEQVSAECVRLATLLGEQGVDALNEARSLLCRHELEQYKPFSMKYLAGDCSALEALLSGPRRLAFDVQRVETALDDMEADFDDWGDGLAHQASVALCNIAENLVDRHHDPVAALARGMELWVCRTLNELYGEQLARGGSVLGLVSEFMSGREIPAFDLLHDVCRRASRGFEPSVVEVGLRGR